MKVFAIILIVCAVAADSASRDVLSNEFFLKNAGHHWNYKHQGKDWKDPEICLKGKSQSPINIAQSTAKEESKTVMKMHYKAAKNVKLVNNGHALQVDAGQGAADMGFMTLTNRNKEVVKYIVKQFHFHTPSEHTLNGKKFPLEMHIVHQKEGASGTDGLAVQGIFFKQGKSNAFLNSLGFLKPPKKKEDSKDIKGNAVINQLRSILMGKKFTYSGSLTTPPCAEGVKWFVNKKVAEASKAQLAAVHKLFAERSFPHARNNGNNRALQKRNSRVIKVLTVRKQEKKDNKGKNKKDKKKKEDKQDKKLDEQKQELKKIDNAIKETKEQNNDLKEEVSAIPDVKPAPIVPRPPKF